MSTTVRRSMALFCVATAATCVAADEWKPVIVSPAKEVELGEQLRTVFLDKHAATTDGNLIVRVAEIGRKVARFSDRPGLSYQFIIVQGDGLQAWSFPGGTVCVTERLARLPDNEVAFALGHEIAHISLRHLIHRLKLEYGLELDFKPKMLATAMRRFDQENEMAADRYGALYAVRADFSFSATHGLLEEMGRDPKAPRQNGSHLDYELRVAALKSFKDELAQCIDYFHSGTAALRAGEIEQAISDLRYFQAEFPQSVSGQVNLGAAYLARVRKDAGTLHDLAEVLPILPEPGVRLRNSYNRVDLESAKNHFLRAVETDPTDSMALAGLALVHIRFHEFELARQYLDAAMEVDPDNPELLLCSGNVYYLAGEFAKARSEYVAALSFRAGWAAAEKNLAMSYEELGMVPEAIALWEGLETDPSYTKEARNRLRDLRNLDQ